MLKLNLPKEPYWLDIGHAGIKLKVLPFTTAIMTAVESQTVQELVALRELRKTRLEAGESVRDLPDIENQVARRGRMNAILAREMGKLAILEWEGVMLPDGSAPAPVSDQAISDLMDVWYIAEAFWKQYTESLQLLVMEGNASRPAPDGISEAGLPTASTA